MQGLIVFSVVLMIMIQKSVVGAISLPNDNSYTLTYNQWEEMNRFQVGGSLLFVYHPNNDLVMHVNNADYTNCNKQYPFGIREKCLKNETLIIVVMADKSGDHYSNSKHTTSDSPHPIPSDSTTSPPPTGLESPQPSSFPSLVSIGTFIVSIGSFVGSSVLLDL
ncbi:hypothetical protein MKX01_025048 [Papaver californicum]|nr:hypothetical protein MKX01_025048 [Papaver californicum]